jgi:hypothetical protein
MADEVGFSVGAVARRLGVAPSTLRTWNRRYGSARMLGAALPYPSLAAAVRRTGPAAVFLWSQVPDTGDPATLPDLRRRRPGARLLLGGPGWPQDGLPEGCRLIGNLPDAVTEVMASLGRG